MANIQMLKFIETEKNLKACISYMCQEESNLRFMHAFPGTYCDKNYLKRCKRC